MKTIKFCLGDVLKGVGHQTLLPRCALKQLSLRGSACLIEVPSKVGRGEDLKVEIRRVRGRNPQLDRSTEYGSRKRQTAWKIEGFLVRT
jgi:hypothetical protein